VAKAKAEAGHNLRTLDDFQADPENPREITPEAAAGLQESLASFGDLSGITWNQKTGQLVAGHQRFDALKKKYGDKLRLVLNGGPPRLVAPGDSAFPVRVVDWDKTRQRMANLAANNPHIAGEFTDAAQAQLQALIETEKELANSLRLELLLEEEAMDKFHADGIDLPSLPDGEKSDFQQITFTLHNDQAETIDAAITQVKKEGLSESDLNENSNGNALSYICGVFLRK